MEQYREQFFVKSFSINPTNDRVYSGYFKLPFDAKKLIGVGFVLADIDSPNNTLVGHVSIMLDSGNKPMVKNHPMVKLPSSSYHLNDVLYKINEPVKMNENFKIMFKDNDNSKAATTYNVFVVIKYLKKLQDNECEQQ